MSGEDWDGVEDMTGWYWSFKPPTPFRWITEKMDGVRAYWSGQKLLSRNGKEIECPKWFTEGLPTGVRLDGEIWMGRGSFERMTALLNSSFSNNETSWKHVKYVLFDMLDGEMTYEQRIGELKRLKLPSFVSVVDVEECRGNDHLNITLQSIVRGNGEGVVLTKPGSRYIGERTRSRLKVKVEQ
jgi:DNA ligase 1